MIIKKILLLIILFLMLSCLQKNTEIKNNDKVVLSNADRSKLAKAKSELIECDELTNSPEELNLNYFEFNDREKYKNYGENPRQNPLNEPISTFSIDVDTASYANARRYIMKFGQLPPEDSVRVEEFINYFDYNYQESDDKPFTMMTEISKSPFDGERYLLRIGIQGKKVSNDNRPDSNLVFLIDVSGSMNSPDKLGLLKSSMILLTNQMRQKDTISIVVYAGSSGLVLEPTNGNEKSKIINAIKELTAGGSTNGAEGIELAYMMAEKSFIKNGINRVILATDGDFNVGLTNFDDLIKLIEKKRLSGIALTTLGFGTGNYNDRLMEQLADKGNGNCFYIDNINEAKKVLVDELSSTLQIIAKDVKIQLEFNPKYVSTYRLLGYENRKLNKEDFDNDKIDAGEIGAGHRVTAIYEITLNGSGNDSIRYKNESDKIKKNINNELNNSEELLFLRLRYKNPSEDISNLIEKPVLIGDIKDKPSEDFLFAAAVSHFAQILRKSQFAENYNYEDVLKIVKKSKADDKWGYRQEFQGLVELAKNLNI